MKSRPAHIALLAALLAATPALAVPILPVSYSTFNGESGFSTYRDDTYTGSGNVTANLSFLSGGLGQLTDGNLATDSIFDNNSYDWVGWLNFNPVIITYDFGAPVTLNGFTLRAASISSMFNDVDLPAAYTLTFSNDGTTFTDPVTRTTTLAESNNPASQSLSIDFLATARYVQYSATDGTAPWQFYSETTFSALPEPTVAIATLPAIILLKRRK